MSSFRPSSAAGFAGWLPACPFLKATLSHLRPLGCLRAASPPDPRSWAPKDANLFPLTTPPTEWGRPGGLCQEPAGPDHISSTPSQRYEESFIAWLAPS